jgi:hypothetical protein
MTDRNNYGDAATSALGNFDITVPCTATSDVTTGARCAVSTSADAVYPGSVVEGMRAIWELGRIAVLDGGPDGLAATDPNTPFARQGLYVP